MEKKNNLKTRCLEDVSLWLTSVILATREVEIRRISV
jgi:hypothetical protein